jgi:hypothetical protein
MLPLMSAGILPALMTAGLSAGQFVERFPQRFFAPNTT